MEIIWDGAKNELLQKTRGVCFEDVRDILHQNQEVAVIKSPVRLGQFYYIVNIRNYIHVVPAIINKDEQLVLKTIFPSRKYNKLYGGKL